MVCRLVEQHQFGGFGHQFCQCRAAPFPARCRFRVARRVEFQPVGHHINTVGFLWWQAAGGVITQCGEAFHRRFLLHIAHADAGGCDARAAIGLNQAGHHLHQGRFARPVAPDQCNTVTRLHDQGQVFEYRITAKCQADVGKLE